MGGDSAPTCPSRSSLRTTAEKGPRPVSLLGSAWAASALWDSLCHRLQSTDRVQRIGPQRGAPDSSVETLLQEGAEVSGHRQVWGSPYGNRGGPTHPPARTCPGELQLSHQACLPDAVIGSARLYPAHCHHGLCCWRRQPWDHVMCFLQPRNPAEVPPSMHPVGLCI